MPGGAASCPLRRTPCTTSVSLSPRCLGPCADGAARVRRGAGGGRAAAPGGAAHPARRPARCRRLPQRSGRAAVGRLHRGGVDSTRAGGQPGRCAGRRVGSVGQGWDGRHAMRRQVGGGWGQHRLTQAAASLEQLCMSSQGFKRRRALPPPLPGRSLQADGGGGERRRVGAPEGRGPGAGRRCARGSLRAGRRTPSDAPACVQAPRCRRCPRPALPSPGATARWLPPTRSALHHLRACLQATSCRWLRWTCCISWWWTTRWSCSK